MVYLDYSATSPLLPEARAAMISAMDLVGNPSALHTPGHLAMNEIESAREKIARLINAEPSEIIFTSGGSESNNTVTNIFAGQPVTVSAIEHPSLLESAKKRCNVTILPVNKNGIVETYDRQILSEQALATTGAAVRSEPRNDGSAPSKTASEATRARCEERDLSGARKQPKLVSVMLANNELGTINDVKSLAKQAHKAGALFHTDTTQALGKIPIDVKDLDVDYMTISSHKIGGPVGIGALYVKKGSPYEPLIIGGHQEHGHRAGTYQTVNIAGFGAAAEYTLSHNLPKLYAEKVRPLRDELASRILREVPHSSINTPLDLKNPTNSHALPHLLNCSFAAAEGESIQLYLDAEADIVISTGSACASGDGKPSHVIMATHDDAEVAHSSVRFSLGPDTTESDIKKVMKYLPPIVKRLQGISTIVINHEQDKNKQ